MQPTISGSGRASVGLAAPRTPVAPLAQQRALGAQLGPLSPARTSGTQPRPSVLQLPSVPLSDRALLQPAASPSTIWSGVVVPLPDSLQAEAEQPAAARAALQDEASGSGLSGDLLLLNTQDPVLQSIYSRLYSCTCTSPSPNSQQEQEFHVNFGRAVRVLRDDIAFFFQRPADMSIYTDDVGFVDNISSRIGIASSIRVHGKEAYRRHLWSLRFHAGIIFSRSEVNILRLWQRTPRTVAVRWTIRCYPRLLNGVRGSVVFMDGVSEYKFNSEGIVYEHTVDIIDWDGLRMGLKKREQHAAVVATPFC